MPKWLVAAVCASMTACSSTSSGGSGSGSSAAGSASGSSGGGTASGSSSAGAGTTGPGASSGGAGGSSSAGATTSGSASTGAGSASGSGGTSTGQSPLPSPRGVYVPTFQQAIVGSGSVADGGLQQLLRTPFVDGFFISRSWTQVESAGPMTFTPSSAACKSIVGDLDAVAAAGKKATLAIGAGGLAPPWICAPDSGVNCFSDTEIPRGTTACDPKTYPAMWDPSYEADFAELMEELAACVGSDAVAGSVLVDVKITGLNDSDEETILPYRDKGGILPCTGGKACQMDAGGGGGWCDESNDLAVFEAAGYTADSGWQAYQSFAQATRDAFDGGLPIGSQISSELLVPAGVPDAGLGTYALYLTERFVADSALRPITCQEQGLAAGQGATTLGISYAASAGVPIGFQMVDSVVDPAPGTCDMASGLPKGSGCTCPDECVLLDAVQNGVSHGARWLEIYQQDLLAFPDAGWYAHELLMDGG